MQIMNAVWAEAVLSALNFVQYNVKCLVYIIIQPVVRMFWMFDYIKEKEISTKHERLCFMLLILFY